MTTDSKAWVLAHGCSAVHAYGEDGWRPAANGQHEHLVDPNTRLRQDADVMDTLIRDAMLGKFDD